MAQPASAGSIRARDGASSTGSAAAADGPAAGASDAGAPGSLDKRPGAASDGIAAVIAGSLKLKLTAFIALIVGLSVGIAFWGAIRTQRHQLLEASERHLRVLHEMLQKTIVATCILTGNSKAVQQMLETFNGDQDIERVRIFDRNGIIRYSSFPAERGEPLSATELSGHSGWRGPLILDRAGSVIHTLVLPMFNQPTCMACHPAGDKVLGVLQVSLGLDPTWRQLAALERSALLATLLALSLIGGAVWASLTYFVDRPLQRMVAVMGQAEQGDLGARVALRGRDELGRLACHFDHMIARLQGTQQELERHHQEQLARADRLATIGELAAAIAHEIRNPLTGISGVLSVLGRDFPPEDPRREIVRQTHELIDRLNQSVENILSYSRPSRPQLQRVHLDDVIDCTLALMQTEADKRRVRIVKPDRGERASAAAVPAVRADPQQLQQVLTNLLLNAIQATPPGGQIWIRTNGVGEGGGDAHVAIEIEDSGAGMTGEQVAKAFHPFFSTKPRGTGLGLPIARQIIEQHHGQITVRSAPGAGTCVRVELRADPGPSGEGR